MHLSELSYKYKTIFWTLMITIIIGGIGTYMRISKLEDPELTVMQAMIVTICPGASAEQVEMTVSNVLEEELRTIDNIAEIVSTSTANMSQISILLEFSVPDDEITQYWDILRRKVKAAQAKLPSGCLESMVMDDFGDVYGMFYAMRGDGFSMQDMNSYAKTIKQALLNVDGVKRVAIFGNQTPVINIDIQPERLAELGVYPAQIVMAINQQLSTVYAGNYQQQSHNIRITVDGKIKNIDDIKNITINGFQDDQFKLSDIATIHWDNPSPQRFSMLYNGETSIGISISPEKDVNVIKVGKEVEKKLNSVMQSIPIGITMDKVFFQPELVKKAINDFMINLIMSVGVVILVLMFTMGFKSGMIIGTGLILTILATFPILYMFDGTLQRISLGAFVLAMGMLVDNAIVVMDGISVDLKYRKGIKFSLFNTAKKTHTALLGATLIAIIAFIPVYLSPDTSGVYVGDLFIVLCISLLISWILAITQVPIFASKIINFRSYYKKSEINKDPFDSLFFRKTRVCLNFMLNRKISIITVTVILLALSAWGFMHTKRTFFPDFNYNQAVVEFTLPTNTNPGYVINQMKQISNELLKMEGINNVTASHGMTPTRYCLVRPFNQVGDNYAEFILEFDDFETMQKNRKKIENFFFDNYPDAYSRFRQYNLSIVSSHTLEVEFSGENLDTLRSLEKKAEAIMYNCDLVNLRTIQSDLSEPSKLIVAKYAKDAAAAMGTSRLDISNSLLAATDGMPIANLWLDDTNHGINLRLRKKDGTRIDDLSNLPVWNLMPNINNISNKDIAEIATGATTTDDVQKKLVSSIPMSTVSPYLKIKSEESVIRRTNGYRTIQAQCEPVRSSSPADVRNSIINDIENIKLPEGYSMRWVGEHNLQTKALSNIISLLPVAVILIILILIVLFNSVKRTVLIFLCLPIAAIGIVPGLLIFNQPFSFVAIVGTIGMAGMLIKNSIVLIDEIDLQIITGKRPYDAVLDATVSRVRPVMMASLTTILGMIPLIPDPMYGALAVTIMCGLLVGTIVTLVILPIIYSLMFKIKK